MLAWQMPGRRVSANNKRKEQPLGNDVDVLFSIDFLVSIRYTDT